MELSRQQWRDFHYPKSTKTKSASPKESGSPKQYRLVNSLGQEVIRGKYAICKWKQKQCEIQTKIEPI
jgi:hypothetical protein